MMSLFPDLTNRLKKRFSHLKKWAKREGVSCFRVYEKDLPDFPVIVDWYGGDVVVWVYDRKRDETAQLKDQFLKGVLVSVLSGLDVEESAVYIKHRGRQKGLSSQYERLAQQSMIKRISEYGLCFEVNLSDYLDTGLFLDHRLVRKWVKGHAQGKRVLNLFAYTGSFTSYALSGGAIATTTVDLNRNYIEWAKRNTVLNGFSLSKTNQFIVADCLVYLDQDLSNRYDMIICDPPTFSNSKKMKTTFSIDDQYPALIQSCVRRLNPGGVVVFSTNSRSFKFNATHLPQGLSVQDITLKTHPPDFRNEKIRQCWVIQCD